MELFIFARFHATEGREDAVKAAIGKVVSESCTEPGCLAIRAFRSTRDRRLYYIHSRWTDEAAFEHHATLPHTLRFLESIAPLVDQPPEVSRTHELEA